MIPIIPRYITLIVSVASAAIGLAVWAIVSAGAGRSGLPPATQRAVRAGAALFLGAWVLAAFALAPAPASLLGRDTFHITPLIPVFGTVPAAALAVALQLSRPLRRALAAAPLPALVAVQVYRALGVLFLILLGLGQLPAHFALPAGWGDIAIGLSAPLVGLALARRMPGARALAVAWNAVGLVDLVVAVGMGTGLLAPLLAPELGRVPPAAAMGVFPMILVPAFAVPLSVLLHLAALVRLRRQVGLGSGLVPEQAG